MSFYNHVFCRSLTYYMWNENCRIHEKLQFKKTKSKNIVVFVCMDIQWRELLLSRKMIREDMYVLNKVILQSFNNSHH